MANRDEKLFHECIASLYEAAAGQGDWKHAGRNLESLVSADFCTLQILDTAGTPKNLVHFATPADAAYASYYHRVDPYQIAGRTRPASKGKVSMAHEIISKDELIRTEYYQDHALPNGQRNFMGVIIDSRDLCLLAVYRDGREFRPKEQALLQALVGHVERAIMLYRRFMAEVVPAQSGRAALDALPFGILIVEGSGAVRFANAWATGAAGVREPVFSLQSSNSRFTHGLRLLLPNGEAARAVEGYVQSVVTGGAGGACLLSPPGDPGSRLALHVSPVPNSIREQTGTAISANGGLAMITIQPLPLAGPRIEMLTTLFNLTPGEAAVALALSGGRSAEDVAAVRNVSSGTVRSQIKVILDKSGAANLRELEQIMASLSHLPGYCASG